VSALGAFAAGCGAGFAVLMMFGATFTAVMFAVSHYRVFTQFAVAIAAIAGVRFHRYDSIDVVVRKRRECRP
jgi:phosphoribulokinase